MLGKAPLAAPYRHACFLSCMPCDWYSNSFIYHITRKGYIATSLLSLMGAGGPGETKRRLQSGEFPGCAGQGGGWAVYSGESRGWQVYYILCLPAKRLQAFFCGRGAVCGWLRREDAASAGGVLLGAAALSPGCPQGCPQLSGGAEGCQQVIHRVIKTPEKTCPKKQAFLWQNTEIAFAYLTIRRNVVKWKSPAQDIVNGWQSQPFRLFPGHYTKSNIHTEATEPKWLTELSRETGVPSLLN